MTIRILENHVDEDGFWTITIKRINRNHYDYVEYLYNQDDEVVAREVYLGSLKRTSTYDKKFDREVDE